MNDLEREFEEMVRANRSTIYTVCYMFSQDQDEVADKGEAMDAEGSGTFVSSKTIKRTRDVFLSAYTAYTSMLSP